MIRRILVTLIPSCFIAASVAADPDATSAAPVADNGGLQEIVVTARRRAEDLQSVPLTVTAITAAMIETQDVTNIEDLNSFVPNMKIAQDRATRSGDSIPAWGFTSTTSTWRARRRRCWTFSTSPGSRC
jgi:iron complex outermembrane receptor protein